MGVGLLVYGLKRSPGAGTDPPASP